MPEFEIAAHAEVLQVHGASEFQRAAHSLRASRVYGENALVVVQFQFARAAGDRFLRVIHERRKVRSGTGVSPVSFGSHGRDARATRRIADEAHRDLARVVDERINALARIHVSALRHVCKTQFVKRL